MLEVRALTSVLDGEGADPSLGVDVELRVLVKILGVVCHLT